MKQIVRGALLLLGMTLGSTAQAGKVTYVHTDAQGTPVMESDAQGNITARFDYTPYGVAVQGMSGSQNGPGYTGHVNDSDTGLVYMQARYYDPVVGRFLSTDPQNMLPGRIQEMSGYAYGNDNPIANIDPTGEYTCDRKANSEFCDKVDKYIDHLKDSKKSYRPGSKKYRSISEVINYIGEKDKAGPMYMPGQLIGDAAAQTDQNGTTTLDLDKNGDADVVASAIGHEAQHDLDSIKWKITAGSTNNRREAEEQYRKTEKSAYATQSVILGGYGKNLTSSEMRRDIEGSVRKEMSAWDRAHAESGANGGNRDAH